MAVTAQQHLLDGAAVVGTDVEAPRRALEDHLPRLDPGAGHSTTASSRSMRTKSARPVASASAAATAT